MLGNELVANYRRTSEEFFYKEIEDSIKIADAFRQIVSQNDYNVHYVIHTPKLVDVAHRIAFGNKETIERRTEVRQEKRFYMIDMLRRFTRVLDQAGIPAQLGFPSTETLQKFDQAEMAYSLERATKIFA